ncbi:MAG: hypothetical protein FWG73_02845 [Planctomycetaceae bacterium]|nr:hypothetical protein [Planctomycetaceae bacterium]
MDPKRKEAEKDCKADEEEEADEAYSDDGNDMGGHWYTGLKEKLPNGHLQSTRNRSILQGVGRIVKSGNIPAASVQVPVIPAKTGTQRNRHHTQCLDSGLRRNDENEAKAIREMLWQRFFESSNGGGGN